MDGNWPVAQYNAALFKASDMSAWEQKTFVRKQSRFVWAHSTRCMGTTLLCLGAPTSMLGHKARLFGRIAHTAWKQSRFVWEHRLGCMGTKPL
jgi:hypothetical protein